MNYQWEESRKETVKLMATDVPFAETHKKYPLAATPVMLKHELSKEK